MARIGILTSGGDAPGMNACIRACVRYALYNNIDVYGIERGFDGLIQGKLNRLNSRSVSGIIQQGGTFLKTARSEEFNTLEGQRHAYETLDAYDIDGLIVIGGDGTFRGARDIYKNFGVRVAGIPGTIDNDLAYTDFTLGFDTAVNTTLWAVNCLRDTMSSHDRVSLLEVMGRNCGDIALYAGVAGGAEYVIVPEIAYNIKEIAKSISLSQKRGKTSNMIILAEGAGNKDEICTKLKELTGITVKTTTLGHIQRGGSPTAADRMLAARMAVRAVDILKTGGGGRVIGIKNNQIIDADIDEALSQKRVFDRQLYDTAHILSL